MSVTRKSRTVLVRNSLSAAKGSCQDPKGTFWSITSILPDLAIAPTEGGHNHASMDRLGNHRHRFRWLQCRRRGGDGRILALDASGGLILLAADPKALRVLGRKDGPGNDNWTHLAVSGDQVFVRDLEGVTAFRWKAALTAPEPAP